MQRFNAGGLSDLVIGREREIQAIKEYINLSQHIVITAPRRYGKTTLVNKVLTDLQDNYLIVSVDIFEASSEYELCQNYLNSVYKSVGIANFTYQIKNSIFDLLHKFKLSYEQDGIKLGYEILQQKDEKLVLQTFNFAEKFAKIFNKKMIVFFDEFGDTSKFGESFLKKIRSCMQKHKQVSYIFAGSQTSLMSSIFLHQDKAFFNFATLMSIDTLDEKSCITFLRKNKFVQNITDEIIELLKKYTRFHPFYLIKVLQDALIIAKLDNVKITVDIIRQAVNKILNDNNAYFENIWHSINNKKYQGSIFKSLCFGNITPINISPSYKSQIIKQLGDKSIINQQKKPTDPFLCLWLDN
jgi:AAA+ ATPase superfamily predicted ATPase